MKREREDMPANNRARKLEGRARRRRFVQGTRAYTHALTNSIAKRARGKNGDAARDRSDRSPA